MYSRVKLLSKDEVGGCAGDGDETADCSSVGDAERQAFTDHVIPLGGILGVSPGLHPLHVWDFYRNLRENEENLMNEGKMSLILLKHRGEEVKEVISHSCFQQPSCHTSTSLTSNNLCE